MNINKSKIEELVKEYTTVVKVVDRDAHNNNDRAYGGVVRSVKGKLQEYITEEVIRLAWQSIGGDDERLEINSKKFKIPIMKDYISELKDEEVKRYILSNIDDYYYKLSVDKQVFIDGKFVLGIECKAYTENAMLKRILVDFKLLKTQFPHLKCYLFQLESQLGGDYSELNEKTFGSHATHTLLSYFKEVDLKIFTFLKGERIVDKPIHKYFKPLDPCQVEKAVKIIANELKEFIEWFMSIQKQFEQFYENIKLTSSQREDAKKKYNGVCKKLHDHYYPDTEYNESTKLLIGSYGKRTNIRPPRDVDVLFIMPDDKFDQYDDNESNGQSQLLQDIKRILSEKYSTTEKIKGWGKVVLVQFADGTHNIELLPAWEKENGKFIIPNTENGGFWETWDPKAEIKKINDSDKKTNGKTKALIRMIKKWSENCSVKLKSFQIEEKVVDFFSFNDSDEEYSILVRDFFGYFYDLADEKVKSHLKTAHNRANKACDLENEGKIEEAIDEWKKIFGSDFPSVESSTKSYQEDKPVLADYPHCEPLRWPFEKIYKVGIDAYIYTENKAKRLGGINSDGRVLPPGLYLKFIARTNAKGIFKYYWQVVNTGEAAKRNNDLRGKIFEGSQVQWEHTKYPGKHWIECFIVQDNICVARSGRFFVNIK